MMKRLKEIPDKEVRQINLNEIDKWFRNKKNVQKQLDCEKGKLEVNQSAIGLLQSSLRPPPNP